MSKSHGFALNLVSEANRLKILSFIRDKEHISRTELAQLANLSLPAVSRIVGLLLRQGYVREVGLGDSRGGRKPVMVEAVPDVGFVIGVDLGGTRILAAAADLHGRVLHVAEARPEGTRLIDSLFTAIREAVHRLDKEQRKRLLGIGIGTPGLLDYTRGVVITAANLGWKNVPLRDRVQEEFNLPAFVDNDANVAALAEWLQGAGRGVQHLVHITVSRGLGAGIIINGQMHRGAGGTAGEIGETFMLESAKTECGWQTLEGLCAGRALVQQAEDALKRGEAAALHAPVTFETILSAAKGGDALSVRLLQRAADYLSVGIANFVNTFDPQLVIVGGMLARAGDLVLKPIREKLDRLLGPVLREKVQVTLGTLGERAGVIGAASLVLHQAFAPPLQHGEAVSLLPLRTY
ncbi:MAG: ROK family transcriptional regulator [Spirochaetota bacterium]